VNKALYFKLKVLRISILCALNERPVRSTSLYFWRPVSLS